MCSWRYSDTATITQNNDRASDQGTVFSNYIQANYESPSDGHHYGVFTFGSMYIDKYGKDYKLAFNATAPTHREDMTTAEVDSQAFDVHLLAFKRKLTLAPHGT